MIATREHTGIRHLRALARLEAAAIVGVWLAAAVAGIPVSDVPGGLQATRPAPAPSLAARLESIPEEVLGPRPAPPPDRP